MGWKTDVEFLAAHLTRQAMVEITGISINQVRRLALGQVTTPHEKTRRKLAQGRKRLQQWLRAK